MKMIDFIATYFSELMGTCVLIGIVEILSSIFWWHFYFSFGIPIFKRTLKVTAQEMKLPGADDLEEYAMSDNPRHAPILVRQVSETSFGFRETLLHFRLFRYVPVMHGNILFDKTNNKIEIRGYINWYILAFACLFLSFTLSAAIESKDFVFLAMSIGLLAIMGNGYLTQQKRSTQLTEIIQKLLT
jgi:hypothetical protein